MDRRTYLASTGAVLGGSLAGCLGNSGSGDGSDGSEDGEGAQTGVLSTAVSDDPADIGDFERLVVSIEEVWVHPAGSEGEDSKDSEDGGETAESGDAGNETTSNGESVNGSEKESEEGSSGEQEGDESDGKTHDESAEPIRIDAGGAKADLVQLQGDAQKVVNSAELDVGTYGQIKLWVADEVDAVLKDGSEADVMTPGNAPLKFNKEFEIRGGTETTFTADFAPHKRGPNGYVLKPVATEVRVEYNELESDAGTVAESGADNETDGANESATNESDA